MKRTVVKSEVNLNSRLLVTADVSKDWLDLCAEVPASGDTMERLEVRLDNRCSSLEKGLREYMRQAERHGYTGMHVVCEPTGFYHQRLLSIAHRLGCTTGLVSGEAVNKLSVVQSNDSSKHDRKDPRVMQLAVRAGKSLKHRILTGAYAELRELGRFYDDESDGVVQVRTRLHAVIGGLFGDLRVGNDFFFKGAGLALVEVYACNPYRIATDGWARFVTRMHRKGRFREVTLRRIWEAVESSLLHVMPEPVQSVYETRVRELHAQWQLHEQRREQYRVRMAELFAQLPESRALKQVPCVSAWRWGRLLGETGPLGSFAAAPQLLRYAGLNLCPRSSGKYVGKTKISKKGRAGLRRALWNMVVFSGLIRKDGPYGAYCQRRKAEDRSAQNTVTIVMRKFLRAIFTLVKKDRLWDLDRLFRDESQVLPGKAA